MFSKILVPIDFSQKSEWAFRAALQVAQLYESEVTLFHVVELPAVLKKALQTVPVSLPVERQEEGSLIKQVVKLSKESLKKVAKKYRIPEGVQVKIVVKKGDWGKAVAKMLLHQKADLMVMGGKLLYRLDEAFEATQMPDVISRSRCPVLAVNADLGEMSIQEMVVATNFRVPLAPVSEGLARLQQRYNCPIRLLYIKTAVDLHPERDLTDIGMKTIEKNRLANATFHISKTSHIKKGIMKFASERAESLIVLITSNHHWIVRLFQGQLADGHGSESDRPVLLLKTVT